MKIDYDAAAAAYAKHRKIDAGLLARLMEPGSLDSKSRVLEVGSGSGNYISSISEALGCECFGLEPSDGMIQAARLRSPSIAWQKGSAETFPYEPCCFDLIYCVDVIHHITRIDAFIREVFRTLRFGGVLYIATDSEATIRKRDPLSKYFPETIVEDLKRYPSIAGLKSSLDKAGFAEIRDEVLETPFIVENVDAYREKAFSCLHLISAEAHLRGLSALSERLSQGPIHSFARYALVHAKKRRG